MNFLQFQTAAKSCSNQSDDSNQKTTEFVDFMNFETQKNDKENSNNSEQKKINVTEYSNQKIVPISNNIDSNQISTDNTENSDQKNIQNKIIEISNDSIQKTGFNINHKNFRYLSNLNDSSQKSETQKPETITVSEQKLTQKKDTQNDTKSIYNLDYSNQKLSQKKIDDFSGQKTIKEVFSDEKQNLQKQIDFLYQDSNKNPWNFEINCMTIVNLTQQLEKIKNEENKEPKLEVVKELNLDFQEKELNIKQEKINEVSQFKYKENDVQYIQPIQKNEFAQFKVTEVSLNKEKINDPIHNQQDSQQMNIEVKPFHIDTDSNKKIKQVAEQIKNIQEELENDYEKINFNYEKTKQDRVLRKVNLQKKIEQCDNLKSKMRSRVFFQQY